MSSQVHSFEPVIGKNPQVIILGSMPGVASLEKVEYYAHPRNAFWKIMAELFGLDGQASYADRIQQISTRPVILWDSLKTCVRPGSLDSNIDKNSVEANDFQALLERYPTIKAIVFNGATSEKYFRQLALPNLASPEQIALLGMPSTSPANAAMNFQQKLERWQELLKYISV